MGLPCSRAACYRRLSDSNSYDEDAMWCSARTSSTVKNFVEDQLGKFHYEVSLYSLRLSPYDNNRSSAIYLYMDGVRIMAARLKMYRKTVFLIIEYRSLHWRDSYHDVSEILPRRRRAPALSGIFAEHYGWAQTTEGTLYSWPCTVYRREKELGAEDREALFTALEISI